MIFYVCHVLIKKKNKKKRYKMSQREKFVEATKIIRDELYYSELLELRNLLLDVIDNKVDSGYTLD